ncbi:MULTISPECIES: DUF5959 family protein [unclassified Streptomyces]|uniref:DUF5959 family protein n=1 Tax=unclassified Streptomyces TaxID=2593676 RepID=UPI0033A3E09F
MAEEAIDLIRLAGEGNSVVLRVSGKEQRSGPDSGGALAGEFLVDTPFVRGSLEVRVFPEELREWQEALDALDAGQDIAWREGARGAELHIERDADGERVHVTVRDDSMSLTAVTVTVALSDAWFDDAYGRLELAWKTWPPAES